MTSLLRDRQEILGRYARHAIPKRLSRNSDFSIMALPNADSLQNLASLPQRWYDARQDLPDQIFGERDCLFLFYSYGLRSYEDLGDGKVGSCRLFTHLHGHHLPVSITRIRHNKSESTSEVLP